MPLVVEDALKIGSTRNERLIQQFLQRLESQLVPLAFATWHEVAVSPALRVALKLRRAGHILGSSYVEVSLSQPG
ncbi:MBL fold metallo-hydrolase, partial [Guyparkeria sp. 1SP6A2]|nr:MBL fold metallo-hydrolase [Guyparkeria sp. 1SP6A2]